MILVISRFKVANGLEEAIGDAFRQRPHLVDTVPGFLGMEVYTQHANPSVFHLVTRWTDRDTFHAWHKSPQHHLSHHMLPKGLKLDPSYTQILEMECLPRKEHPGDLPNLLLGSTLLVEDFLTATETVLYCAISPDGQVHTYNDVLLNVLKTSRNELEHTPIWHFLTDPDRHRLQDLFKSGIPKPRERMRINFVDSSHTPHTLDCVVQKISPTDLILIGEQPQPFNQTAVEELIKIQNEMTVTMRRELKSGKRLSESNLYLDELVRERTSELVKHQERLRNMLVELTLVEQRERQKLANDLHDFLAQLLVVCRLKLAQIEHDVLAPDHASLIREVDGLLDRSLTFTRTFIGDLHPTILHQEGLLPALKWLTTDMGRYGLRVSIPDEFPSLPISEEIGILVYKTVRELLFNVLKHSGTDDAVIHWECVDDLTLLISVTDNGKGFDVKTRRLGNSPGHLGLFFYRERIEGVKGRLEIISGPDQGTQVTLRVPFTTS